MARQPLHCLSPPCLCPLCLLIFLQLIPPPGVKLEARTGVNGSAGSRPPPRGDAADLGRPRSAAAAGGTLRLVAEDDLLGPSVVQAGTGVRSAMGLARKVGQMSGIV